MTKQERDMARLTAKMHKSWESFVDATMERTFGKEWGLSVTFGTYAGVVMDQAAKYLGMCQFQGPCPLVVTVVDSGEKRVVVWGNNPTPKARETKDARKAWVEVFEHWHIARKTLWRGLWASYCHSVRFLGMLIKAVAKGKPIHL